MKKFTANKDASITIASQLPDGTGTQTDIDAAQVPAFRRDPAFDAELRAALPDYCAELDAAAAAAAKAQ